jgi:hypothetical protein
VTGPKDVAASVRQRLLNRARETGQDFQRVLVRYGIERLLYRLSRSPHRDRFVLKGAMLFAAWAEAPFRSTGDLDLLGFGSNDPSAVAAIFTDLCRLIPAGDPDDGLRFDEKVEAAPMREDADYPGVRVRIDARLKNTRIPLLIDVGFGDVIHPAPIDLSYPSLLGNSPETSIRAYPPETVIAEKLEAMARFDEGASRLKDHYDIWAISETFPFTAATLASAVRATFDRRGRPTPTGWPGCLTPEFAARADKLDQWRAFLRRTSPTLAPPPFAEIVVALRAFLEPVLESLRGGAPASADMEWRPGAGWEQRRSP